MVLEGLSDLFNSNRRTWATQIWNQISNHLLMLLDFPAPCPSWFWQLLDLLGWFPWFWCCRAKMQIRTAIGTYQDICIFGGYLKIILVIYFNADKVVFVGKCWAWPWSISWRSHSHSAAFLVSEEGVERSRRLPRTQFTSGNPFLPRNHKILQEKAIKIY